MTIYLTKVWGFGDPCGPLQFSTRGWRDSARAELKAGDYVVLVGTKGPETDEAERGHLLGMMEPSREVALSQDFDFPTRSIDFKEDGEYRWPYALLNRRAWIFVEPRTLLEEVSSRNFSMDAASGIVPLTNKESEKVMELRRREVPLLMPVRARARVEGVELARRKSAPPPTTSRKGVMHMRRASALTYCMQIESASQIAFKIGWSFDDLRREREFNQSSMPSLGGLRYRVRIRHLWESARSAFAMEQAILQKFDRARHPANREILYGVTYEEIESAWIDYIKGESNKR